MASKQEVASWPGHAGTPACLQWAPRRLLVASACNALALWIPAVDFLQPAAPVYAAAGGAASYGGAYMQQ